MQVEVTVQELVSHLPIATETWQTWFGEWLQNLQSDLPEAAGYELSLRLTDDAEISQLNATYRQKNQPTDVLAFAALENEYPHPQDWPCYPIYLGDIVISVETATRQAEARGHDTKVELAWLATHGLLHLLGWDHPDEESLQQMLQRQASLLQPLGMVAAGEAFSKF
jgi:probable rRNA maturation factor